MLEEVASFKYLDSPVAADGLVEGEVKHRVMERSKVQGALKKMMKGRNICLKIFMKVLWYQRHYIGRKRGVRGSQKDRNWMFEMKCLRSMVGVTRLDSEK